MYTWAFQSLFMLKCANKLSFKFIDILATADNVLQLVLGHKDTISELSRFSTECVERENSGIPGSPL